MPQINDTGFQKSYEEYLKFAEEAENQGNIQTMLKNLNMALQKTDNKKPILEKLLEYHLNDTNPTRALKILKSLIEIEPKNAGYYKQAISILLEIDNAATAEKLAKHAFKQTNNSYFKNIFEDKNQNYLIQKQFSDTTLTMLFSLFTGREGVYARQWKSSDGKTGYMPVYEPLSEKVIRNHLNGNITIGIYQHRLDSTINWICIDVDIAKFALKQALSDDEKWKELDIATQNTAKSIADECSKFNIPVYIEHSGYKGRHCWIFLAKPLPARLAKRFGEHLKLNIPSKIPEVAIEVFPKQNFVKTNGVGNLVKMPLGIHLANGKRSCFLDSKGREIINVDKYLKNIQKASESEILDYLNYYRLSGIYENAGTKQMTPSEKMEIPVHTTQYNIDCDKEFQYLIYKCPVIKEIYNNAICKNELSYDEMIVLTHTVGHLENGVEAVNSIFAKCFNIQQEKFLKSKLKGNPVSCAKIRSRVPDITSKMDCNCQFVYAQGLYPTPVLHLQEQDIPSKIPRGLDINSVNFQNALEDYIKLKKQTYETKLIMKEYEDKFEKLFKNSGVDTFNTAIGKFRRVVDENGNVTYKLDV